MNTEWKSLIVIAALFGAVILFAALMHARAAPLTPAPESRPYSCRQLDEAEKKCAYDPKCDKREIDRLRKECLRDGGRP